MSEDRRETGDLREQEQAAEPAETPDQEKKPDSRESAVQEEHEEHAEHAEHEERDEPEVFEHPDYAQELEQIVRGDLPDEEKREKLNDYHYNDIADVLEKLTPEERRRLYHLLGAEEVSEIFAYLDDASDYIEELTPEVAAHIVQEMDADDAVDVLEDLDQAHQQAIISRMDEEAQADVKLIQSYPEDEIGSKMTTNYIAIQRGISIKQAMRSLVEQAADNDNLSTIYVLDGDRFYGAVTLQDLIIAREHTDLEGLITTSYPYVYDHETVDACIEQLKDYSEDSIPVVDSDMQLLGVITSQDLVEVVDEELGEDYAKLAGLIDEEDLNEPLHQSIRKRIPWLIVLMFLGMVVSSVVGTFEGVMAIFPIAVAFQSMILDMSGNSGTQSLAVTIRVLSNQLDTRQKLHLILKEARVGFTNGCLLGSISFTFVGLFIHFIKGKPLDFAFTTSGCIGLSMVVAMTISSLSGTLIPMLFKKIHIDPAVASGPMITTLSDLVAVCTYYTLVTVLLLNLMHFG